MPSKPGERYVLKRHKDKERQYNASRPARHDFYASKEWRRLRDWYRARHPICEECMRQGRVTAAELVHHKKEISQGGEPLDVDNLESLCKSCHNRIHKGIIYRSLARLITEKGDSFTPLPRSSVKAVEGRCKNDLFRLR